jgi:chitin synthase
MWHETPEEMMQMLKSIFRMDSDQAARRLAQKYLDIVDPDYYEFEGDFGLVFYDAVRSGNKTATFPRNSLHCQCTSS